MIVQFNLEMSPADLSLIRKTKKEVVRSYKWGPCDGRSTANIVDQLALITGKKKAKVVEEAVRLTALFVKMAGPEALDALVSGDPDTVMSIIDIWNRMKGDMGSDIEEKAYDMDQERKTVIADSEGTTAR